MTSKTTIWIFLTGVTIHAAVVFPEFPKTSIGYILQKYHEQLPLSFNYGLKLTSAIMSLILIALK